VLRIERQGRRDLILRWQSDLGGPDLYRSFGRVITARKPENNTGGKEKQSNRFLSAISHGNTIEPI
jgi:hypothetical protein